MFTLLPTGILSNISSWSYSRTVMVCFVFINMPESVLGWSLDVGAGTLGNSGTVIGDVSSNPYN